MNKKLTPMQELISKLHPNFFTEGEAKYYLEREKQVIEDAYTDGCCNWDSETDAQDYYNQKFRK